MPETNPANIRCLKAGRQVTAKYCQAEQEDVGCAGCVSEERLCTKCHQKRELADTQHGICVQCAQKPKKEKADELPQNIANALSTLPHERMREVMIRRAGVSPHQRSTPQEVATQLGLSVKAVQYEEREALKQLARNLPPSDMDHLQRVLLCAYEAEPGTEAVADPSIPFTTMLKADDDNGMDEGPAQEASEAKTDRDDTPDEPQAQPEPEATTPAEETTGQNMEQATPAAQAPPAASAEQIECLIGAIAGFDKRLDVIEATQRAQTAQISAAVAAVEKIVAEPHKDPAAESLLERMQVLDNILERLSADKDPAPELTLERVKALQAQQAAVLESLSALPDKLTVVAKSGAPQSATSSALTLSLAPEMLESFNVLVTDLTGLDHSAELRQISSQLERIQRSLALRPSSEDVKEMLRRLPLKEALELLERVYTGVQDANEKLDTLPTADDFKAQAETNLENIAAILESQVAEISEAAKRFEENVKRPSQQVLLLIERFKVIHDSLRHIQTAVELINKHEPAHDLAAQKAPAAETAAETEEPPKPPAKSKKPRLTAQGEAPKAKAAASKQAQKPSRNEAWASHNVISAPLDAEPKLGPGRLFKHQGGSWGELHYIAGYLLVDTLELLKLIKGRAIHAFQWENRRYYSVSDIVKICKGKLKLLSIPDSGTLVYKRDGLDDIELATMTALEKMLGVTKARIHKQLDPSIDCFAGIYSGRIAPLYPVEDVKLVCRDIL